MKRKEYLYEFTLKPCGWGTNPEEAWENCKEAYDINDEYELPDCEIVNELEEEDE